MEFITTSIGNIQAIQASPVVSPNTVSVMIKVLEFYWSHCSGMWKVLGQDRSLSPVHEPPCCCCCCQVASVVSDSVQPHRWQPISIPRPWDSPGKNTGVGCHFLLLCMKVKSESEVAQSCPTLSNSMDCRLPGSSVHGIFQARVLEWGAIAFSGLHSQVWV